MKAPQVKGVSEAFCVRWCDGGDIIAALLVNSRILRAGIIDLEHPAEESRIV